MPTPLDEQSTQPLEIPRDDVPPRTRLPTRWLIAGGLAVIVVGAVLLHPGGPLSTRSSGTGTSPDTNATPGLVAPTSSPSVATINYLVRPGDTLKSIAQTVYGDSALWARIYEANRGVIGPDPDALRAGTSLRIPAP